jgi:dTDP-4-amino-4,6-dideoxygalactose transaminase
MTRTPAFAEILDHFEREGIIKPFEHPIYVTRPFLPPLEAFCKGLAEIWDNRWLTNNGPFLKRFGETLENFFGTENVCLFNNGTQALQIALKGMEISGEVITTPFTFVATAHALSWNGIQPVFVDIEPEYYTIDPERVETAITPETTAILAVHVYGHPCRLEALADIARRHGLKLIYDAAHAFGLKIGGRNIAHYGDISMFSFHATKMFHSIEGGMLVFRRGGLKEKFDFLKNFGFKNEMEVVSNGTNAKMNEIQALMGIQVLSYFQGIKERQKKITEVYRSRLKEIPGIRLTPDLSPEIDFNYGYLPIEVEEEKFGMSRDGLYEKLKDWNVFSRRYFYPLVCDYSCYRDVPLKDPLTVARRVAGRILTLPIYDSLDLSDAETICDIIGDIHARTEK